MTTSLESSVSPAAEPAYDIDVAQLFLAYFERAPEYEALNYYRVLYEVLRSQLNNTDQARLQLSRTIYEGGKGSHEIPLVLIEHNSAFVTHLYHSVLGRQPDAEGHAYWLQELDSGYGRAELVDIFLRAAALDPRDGGYLANRTEIALSFAHWKNSNPGILPTLKYNAAQVLENVTENPATLKQAYAKLYEHQPHPQPGPSPEPPAPAPEAKLFVLTELADHFVGTELDDVFLAPPFNQGRDLEATLQTGDSLDGDGGRDLLIADLIGREASPTLNAIDHLRIYNSASNKMATLDLSQAEGHDTLELLTSAGALLVSHAGAIQTLRIVGSQADVVAVEGITNAEHLRVDLEAVSQAGGWGTIWLGDEESTYAQDGPYVMWAETLDLYVTDNAQGVNIRNLGATTMNIVAAGDNHVRFEANASSHLNISGYGALRLYESPITGHFNLWGEYLRTLDTTGFQGTLEGIWIANADDPNFVGAQIRLGAGRQTIGFDGSIAQDVTIHGVTGDHAWTTLQLMQAAYDSLATFDSTQVSGINALTLMQAAAADDYHLLHGATAFTFNAGIERNHTATLHVDSQLDTLTVAGNLRDHADSGNLIVQSDDILPELNLYLGNQASESGYTTVNFSIEVAARDVQIELSQTLAPGQHSAGTTYYSLDLIEGWLASDPEGSIASITLSGDQDGMLDLSELGSSLHTVDASAMSGYFEVVLSGHHGLSVFGSQGTDTIILDTTTDWSTDINTVYGLASSTYDVVTLRLSGDFADNAWSWDALDVGDEETAAQALETAFALLDASAGGVAGWFVRDNFTYFLAKEDINGQEGRAALAIEGTDWDLWPDFWPEGNILDIWL